MEDCKIKYTVASVRGKIVRPISEGTKRKREDEAA